MALWRIWSGRSVGKLTIAKRFNDLTKAASQPKRGLDKSSWQISERSSREGIVRRGEPPPAGAGELDPM